VIVSISSLVVGLVVGYLGQRSRMCTIGGLRDYVLVRDTALLKGVGAMLLASWLAFGLLHPLAHSDTGRHLIAAGTKPSGLAAAAAILAGALVLGFVATLSGACPLRQHVLAGQGRFGAWAFLAGFYLAAVVYTAWIAPHIGSWPI
jgi:Na+/phosphate symporter